MAVFWIRDVMESFREYLLHILQNLFHMLSEIANSDLLEAINSVVWEQYGKIRLTRFSLQLWHWTVNQMNYWLVFAVVDQIRLNQLGVRKWNYPNSVKWTWTEFRIIAKFNYQLVPGLNKNIIRKAKYVWSSGP